MTHKAKVSVSSFVASVVGADERQIRPLIDEERANRDFHESMEAKRQMPTGQRKTQASVQDEVGMILYAMCRWLKPDNVVETGVASGVSTSHFLCALDDNGKGKLHSIDYPTFEPDTGWIIPEQLKSRWELLIGRSSEHLAPMLETLGTIGIFFHDSEHTYSNMTWEYESAWKHLAKGGILLSHNIDFTKAFPEFCKKNGLACEVFQNLGAVVKP